MFFILYYNLYFTLKIVYEVYLYFMLKTMSSITAAVMTGGLYQKQLITFKSAIP